MDNLTMEELKKMMELAKNGDKNAFSKIYQYYFKPVFRYIYLRTGKKEETEDLTQIVFLKIYKNISNYRDLGQNPLAYFFTVARNTVIDRARKKKELLFKDKENQAFDVIDDKALPQDLLIKDEQTLLVRKAVRELNDNQQEVIILKFVEELPNSEIAEILNKNETAVRQIQSRAIKVLRLKLKELK